MADSTLAHYRHPVRFYLLSTAIPWALWFAAAYASHRPGAGETAAVLISVLGIIGVASPMIVAFVMMYADAALRQDLGHRLFQVRRIGRGYLLLTCFLMLGSILLAQAISLLFGHSADQFRLSGGFTFSAGIVPAWFVLLAAPALEELAWHSYGTDCLRRHWSLFTASMVFAFFWVLWHVPLSFIQDYYHSNVAETGWIYGVNFAVSLFPYVLIMNWLYYKTGRNILVAVIFHVTAGFFNEIFATHPDSKIIQTLLLLLLTVVIVLREPRFFFSREYAESL